MCAWGGRDDRKQLELDEEKRRTRELEADLRIARESVVRPGWQSTVGGVGFAFSFGKGEALPDAASQLRLGSGISSKAYVRTDD